jgi:hypothetical protein
VKAPMDREREREMRRALGVVSNLFFLDLARRLF